jgi:hypothetical protein
VPHLLILHQLSDYAVAQAIAKELTVGKVDGINWDCRLRHYGKSGYFRANEIYAWAPQHSTQKVLAEIIFFPGCGRKCVESFKVLNMSKRDNGEQYLMYHKIRNVHLDMHYVLSDLKQALRHFHRANGGMRPFAND